MSSAGFKALMASMAAMSVAIGTSVASGQLQRPATGHEAYNFIPFGAGQTCIQHQAFASSLWSGPTRITGLGFSINHLLQGQEYSSDIRIAVGYTVKIPGQDIVHDGLDGFLEANPEFPLTDVFNHRIETVLSGATEDQFQFVIEFDEPFCYDPSVGNLLIEIESTWVAGANLSVSRTTGSSASSRAYNSTLHGNSASPETATRIEFYEEPCGQAGFSLRADGSCPGMVMVSWDGATPDRDMGVVYADAIDRFTISSGPCAGTALGLGGRRLRLLTMLGTGGGSGSVTGRAGASSCGGFVQLVVVDASPCTTSNVAQLP